MPLAPTTQQRAPQAQRYYFEATLALASDAAAASSSRRSSGKKGRRVRGLRLGWALVGATPQGLLGHAEASVGWDGGLQRVYSNVREWGVMRFFGFICCVC